MINTINKIGKAQKLRKTGLPDLQAEYTLSDILVAHWDLTKNQVRIYLQLVRDRKATAHDLSMELDLNRSTINDNLKRLKEKHLVRRRTAKRRTPVAEYRWGVYYPRAPQKVVDEYTKELRNFATKLDNYSIPPGGI